MRYLSVCSGMHPEGRQLENELGWECAGFSDIEDFASAVLAHRYPDIPNYGDMTRFEEWNIEPGTVDLLMGGTPCQSFSMAGFRKGMDDDRGNLALVFLKLARHVRARWLVWENVPGVLSSAGGRDFGSLLGGLVELGYGFAYRVLDSQYFGVAQRRRRIFLVGYLGDWRPPTAVLFERESMSRDTAPGRESRNNASNGVVADSDDPSGQGDLRIAFTKRGGYNVGVHKNDVIGTLDTGQNKPMIACGDRIRRLTPLECERLQAMEDNWTLVPFKGGMAKDEARYHGIGNSWCVNVIMWLCRRLQTVDEMTQTLKPERTL